jgi:hypothetical protein
LTSAAIALSATQKLNIGIGLLPATVYHPLFAAMELTTWLEVAFTVVTTASVTRLSAVKVAIRSLVFGKREARSRPMRRDLPAANDDEDRSPALAA